MSAYAWVGRRSKPWIVIGDDGQARLTPEAKLDGYFWLRRVARIEHELTFKTYVHPRIKPNRRHTHRNKARRQT